MIRPIKPARQCSVETCDRPVLAKGYCTAHYERVQKYGDPCEDRPIRKPKIRDECYAEGCTRPIKSLTWCSVHYQRVRTCGSPDGIRCAVGGCGKRVVKNPLCTIHWRNYTERGCPILFPTCKIEGCNKIAPSGKRGWCMMHYSRWAKKRDLGGPGPAHWQPPHSARPGYKWCSLCRDELSTSEFTKNRSAADRLATYCRDCTSIKHMARNYGISPERYRAILIEQDYACAACKLPETAKHQSGRVRRLSVDHDHSCANGCSGKKSCGECVRGLLCARCNSMLGMCNDNVDLLSALMDYLITRQENHASNDRRRRDGSDGTDFISSDTR